MKAFEYVDVQSAADAVKHLPEGASRESYGREVYLKAGGIDLIDQMKERMIEPDRLVNLRGAEASMRYIQSGADGTLRVGALATLTQIGRDEGVRRLFPGLARAAASAATPQIRNVATAGGNLTQRPRCWYFRAKEFVCLKKGGDICFAKEGENQYHAIFGSGPSYIVHPSNLALPLVAAEGELVVLGRKGERTIAARDFFVMPDEDVMNENVLGTDELITELRFPAGLESSDYYELREKLSYDWPLVSAATARTKNGWRVVLGAVAPVPWRAEAAEAVLGNSDLTPELAAAAGEAAAEGATPLRYNSYKVDLIKVAVKRSLLKAAGMEAHT